MATESNEFFMKCYLLSILSLFLAIITYGQPIQTDRLISKKDSILLNSFWAEFKKAINTNNKNELASLCVFPFYCAPCRNDSLFKGNNETAIKITKQLFVESQYKVFLADSVKKEVNDFRSYLVSTFDQKGFMFIYHLKGPRENWEGIQGIIYLYKLRGKYRITAIDTHP